MTAPAAALRPPLVLLADEREWSARSLESILGANGYAVLRAHSGRNAIDLGRSARPDVLIVDAQMPDMPGIDVCHELKADVAWDQNTPIVMTASRPAARALRMAAYRAGVWEFFGQPLDGEALLLKLANYTRPKRQVDRLREESLVESLTGLYTVRGLARRAREIGAEAHRRGGALTCLVLAAVVRDAPDALSQSPAAGAVISERLRAVVRECTRASDIVGHIGEAELGIIAPGTDSAGAARLLERLRRQIAAGPVEILGRPVVIEIEAGYCGVPNCAESSIDAVEILLRAANALTQLRLDGAEAGPGAFGQPTAL